MSERMQFIRIAMRIAAGLIVILACVQAVSATDISGAADITTPGFYYLTTDLSGAHIGNQYTFGIASSDVILDGGGHTINEGGAGIFEGIRKPWSNPPLTNITIRNLTVNGYTLGISTMMMNLSSIENVNVSSSGHIGILMDGSDNCAIRDSSVSTTQTFQGVQIVVSNGVILENVTLLDNAGPGVQITGGSGHAVLNSTVTGNSALTDQGGVVFDTVLGGAIINTSFSSNRFDAVNLTNSSANVVSQNRMSDHLGAGVVIYQGDGASAGNQVQENTIINNHQGVVLDGTARGNVTGNNIINNIFNDIAGPGYAAAVRVKTGQNNTASGNTVLNCSGSAFLLEDAVGNQLVQNLADSDVAEGIFKLDFLTEQRNNRLSVPDYVPFQDYVTLWNGTTIPAHPGKVWYFFNGTQSPSGMNMAVNLTVAPSIPLSGNLTIRLNTTNLTADPLDWSTPWWNQYSGQNGMTGGRITNTTRTVTFTGHDPLVPDNPSMVLPVEFTYGENFFNGVSNAFTHDYAVIVNHNPPVDAPALAPGTSYNLTESTNWTTIPDFTAAKPSFVVDNTSTGVILGNVTYLTPVNLTNQSFCISLASMGQSLSFAAAGNVIGFNMGNPGIRATMNASARLTMYPNGFTFTNPSDLVLVTVPDGGVPVPVWTGPGGWATGANNYIDTNSLVAQDGKVTFDSLHFSTWACEKAGAGPSTVHVTAINPTSGQAGSTVMATITGTNFTANLSTRANLTSGGTVIQGTTTSATTNSVKATFVIPISAPQGPWDVTIINPGGDSGTKSGAFTVTAPPSPTVSSVSPTSGSRNSTVPFTLSGTKFSSGVVVNFTNNTFTASDGTRNLTATIISQTQTTIKGTVDFPPGAPMGKWNVVVTNPYTPPVTKGSAFTVTAPPSPTISSINPTSGPRNTTVPFTLSGTKFVTGAVVNLTNSTYTAPDGYRNVTAVITSQTSTKIIGTVYIPLNAPNGKWDIVVTNPDVSPVPKYGAFTVTDPSKPTISSVSPTSGPRNTTVPFTLSGTKFVTGAVVNFTNSTFTAPDGYRNLTGTVTSVTPTKITGTISLPLNAPLGKWDVVVTNPDVSPVTKSGAFTVSPPQSPTISSVVPTSGFRNSTVMFSLSGTKFSSGAIVNFTNSTYTAPDGYRNLTGFITSVTSTKIMGTVYIPLNVPNGKWDIVVTNPDVPPVTKSGPFTVNNPSKPTISSVTPTSGYRGMCYNFTLSGTNFRSGIVVNFTNSTYVAPDGFRNVTTMITSQSTTQVKGVLYIPGMGMVPTGKWDIVATNPDAPEARKNSTFTVK